MAADRELVTQTHDDVISGIQDGSWPRSVDGPLSWKQGRRDKKGSQKQRGLCLDPTSYNPAVQTHSWDSWGNLNRAWALRIQGMTVNLTGRQQHYGCDKTWSVSPKPSSEQQGLCGGETGKGAGPAVLYRVPADSRECVVLKGTLNVSAMTVE